MTRASGKLLLFTLFPGIHRHPIMTGSQDSVPAIVSLSVIAEGAEVEIGALTADPENRLTTGVTHVPSCSRAR